LSNEKRNDFTSRDDETYFRGIVLSDFLLSRLYLPKVLSPSGVYLQRHPDAPPVPEWVLEIKYSETEAGRSAREERSRANSYMGKVPWKTAKLAMTEAKHLLSEHRQKPEFASRDDIQFVAAVLTGQRGGRCALSLQEHRP
jgi:hypothetical protein